MAKILLLDCAPFCGGAQESLLTLAVELSARGQELLLLCADASPGGLAERAAASGLIVRQFSCRHWPKSLLGMAQYYSDSWRFRTIWQVLEREFQPEVIIANCLRSALLLQRCRPSLAAVILHDRDLRCPAMLPRILAGNLAAVLAISSAVSEKWQGKIAPSRLFVVPNGFVLPAWPAAVAGRRPAGQTFRIILVADFVPWKNHRLFLQTVAILKRDWPGLQAVIRGRARLQSEERYRQNIVSQAKTWGLLDCLDIIDHPGSALPDITSADLLVSCSEYEPFGRTLVEALALGKPVVAVVGGGVQEILTGCPVASVCPPKPEALAEAIRILLARLPGEGIAQAARMHASKFSSGRYAEQVLSVCQQVPQSQ